MIVRTLAASIIGASLLLANDLRVPLRSRHEAFRGSDQWQEFQFTESLDPGHTAIVICDMWDKHWCRGATQRVGLLVEKMAPVLEAARKSGIIVIHAPSDTMNFYEGSPQRKRMQALPAVAPPQARHLNAPELPVDSAGGGCDTPPDQQYQAWTREHPGLRIADEDFVSDKGDEIYGLLKQRNVTRLLVMGVHTNMCVLNRSFAIKQMTAWGVPCILIRDLTDAMYNPQDEPHVSHEQGTRLVIEYIEKYWAPTVTSDQLLSALAASGK